MDCSIFNVQCLGHTILNYTIEYVMSLIGNELWINECLPLLSSMHSFISIKIHWLAGHRLIENTIKRDFSCHKSWKSERICSMFNAIKFLNPTSIMMNFHLRCSIDGLMKTLNSHFQFDWSNKLSSHIHLTVEMSVMV